ncbi:hypothetical protein [Serratia phage X20]|uniref:Uncharacterized protein n=1 Tax=Serratia phage X20 TaxID=2006942 RepID=A0A1Z1LYY8_9CAUD|nr:hypothetical protein KNT72_gp078 [Serratia phage X20]ARW58051.1 hypothetical protein [Serratia phage X20]
MDSPNSENTSNKRRRPRDGVRLKPIERKMTNEQLLEFINHAAKVNDVMRGKIHG